MRDSIMNKYLDDALLRLAAGDMGALSDVYDKLGRRIFMLAYAILRNRADAEDIMQETFLKIATQAHTYEKNSNAIAFILTVARNLSLNLLAKRRRSESREKALDDNTDLPYGEQAMRVGELDALSVLDTDERQIVILRLDCKMKHRDIAALFSISEAATQKRYRRALEKLKKYYKETE